MKCRTCEMERLIPQGLKVDKLPIEESAREEILDALCTKHMTEYMEMYWEMK